MPVPKAFLKLALPAIAAQLINILYNSFRLLLISCVSGSFLIWLICMISPAAVSSIFTNDMDLIAYTNKSMRVYLAMLLIYGIQVACQYSFVALDQAPKAIFLTIWRKIIILIPLIFLYHILFQMQQWAFIWRNRSQIRSLFVRQDLCFMFITENWNNDF